MWISRRGRGLCCSLSRSISTAICHFQPRAPRSSVRRHLVSPKALPPQRASASPKVQKCAQDSPAKRWRSQAERSLSPVSTGTRPCAADSEDKTTVSLPENDDLTRLEIAARIAGLGEQDSAVLETYNLCRAMETLGAASVLLVCDISE